MNHLNLLYQKSGQSDELNQIENNRFETIIVPIIVRKIHVRKYSSDRRGELSG